MAQAQADAGELDHGEERGAELVVAGGDASVIFGLVNSGDTILNRQREARALRASHGPARPHRRPRRGASRHPARQPATAKPKATGS